MQNKYFKLARAAAALGLFVIILSAFQPKRTVWLSSLDLTKMVQGWDKPVLDINKNKKPLSVGKQIFEKGIGTIVKSYVWINLAGGSDRFIASVGVDNDTSNRSVAGAHRFKIFGDGKLLWQSVPLRYGDAARKVDINVKKTKTLILVVINIGKSDSNLQLDWADARFVVSGQDPQAISPPREAEVILTPKPGLQPYINGPKVYGCRPEHPFLYRIPATGVRPMQFKADHLPAGLTLNSITGIITGSITKHGDYNVMLHVKNGYGADSRIFKICCGNTLALTPTMGWNDWYAHYARITDKMMRDAADIIVSSGMADAGYQYVNVDDCWMNKDKDKDAGRVGPARDAKGNILPNSYFPDMKAMAAYIHSKGLKAGIYTSPGPETCGGFTGSYQHEAQDAKQFAGWGFDFLKYDWCSYGNILGNTHVTTEIYQKPYSLMGAELKKQNRDMVFNLCQYGMGQVWKWGAEVGGNSWRTGDDLGFGLNRLFEVALKNAGYAAYAKPGAWNDPDYIQIGYVGSAFEGGLPVHTNLSPNEQYAFVSMWCLLAAPLVYSGDLSKLDKFTLNVLCNPEVIAIDQDPLGKSARAISKTEENFILLKDLEDGSKAAGLCNSSEIPQKLTLRWDDAGLKGKQMVRNLWKQKNIGVYDHEFSMVVPRHGVVMVKISGEK
jgi:alpha-galactosidase